MRTIPVNERAFEAMKQQASELDAAREENAALKAGLARTNLKIQEWWWKLGHGNPVFDNMESFMSEHQIPMERPK